VVGAGFGRAGVMPLLTRLGAAGLMPLALTLAAAGLTAQSPALAAPPPLPATTLAVRADGEWRRWWTSADAPAVWPAEHPLVQAAVQWESLGGGLERGELQLSGAAVGLRFRVLLVRLDPARFQFRLRQATRDYGLRGAWTLDSAAPDAVLALNAGQFEGGIPWGWLVSGGRELQPPGAARHRGGLLRRRGPSLDRSDPRFSSP